MGDDTQRLSSGKELSRSSNELTDNAVVEVDEKKNGFVSEPSAVSPHSSVEADSILNSQLAFSIVELRHPGGWRTNSEIVNLLARAESFEISFSASGSGKGPKHGSIKMFFHDAAEAREAYLQAQKVKVDGNTVVLNADSSFFEPASCSSRPFFTVPPDAQLRSRTIYALNLPGFANRDTINSILDADAIEEVQFLPLEGLQQQAEVRFTTTESAHSAVADVNGFEFESDGENLTPSVMKVLSPDDYERFVEEERKPQAFNPPPIQPAPSIEPLEKPKLIHDDLPEAPTTSSAPVIDEDDVADAFIRHVEEQRLNWAELNKTEELYEICDVISQQFEGLPDSILKPAMLKTLERHLSESQSHWMRDHIQDLIQNWKREVLSEHIFQRETQVKMRAPDYVPVIQNKKKTSKQSKAGRTKMGVGALLQSVRQTFRSETGNFDVDEDDTGNILIGGETLSFESWARLNKTSQPDVVSMNAKKPGKQQKPKPEIHDYKKFKQEQKEKFEKRMGNKKMKVMKRHKEEMEALNQAELEAAAGGSSVSEEPTELAPPPPKPPKELDEGEIDSDEEKEEQRRKRKRNSSSSSSSSSSSGEDDGNEPVNARLRRQMKRKHKKRKQQDLSALITKLYQNRQKLIGSLPQEQKAAFITVLRAQSSSSGRRAEPTLQQMSDMFSGLAR